MRAVYECRCVAKTAAALLQGVPGTIFADGWLVKYSVPMESVDFLALRDAEVASRMTTGTGILSGWDITRRYTRAEWAAASHALVSRFRTFEPAGEECGTVYDDTGACPECAAGGVQVSPLRLPASRLPRGVDIAITIGGEIVVSKRFRECAERTELTGASFGPVEAPRAPHRTNEGWFQLRVTSQHLEVAEVTTFGRDPFDTTTYGRCPRGDLAGLNLLSELFLKAPPTPAADFAETRQRVGLANGVGLLRARRLLVLSARARTVLLAAGMKSLQLEIAHVVP